MYSVFDHSTRRFVTASHSRQSLQAFNGGRADQLTDHLRSDQILHGIRMLHACSNSVSPPGHRKRESITIHYITLQAATGSGRGLMIVCMEAVDPKWYY
ncbi:hypothetical protein Mapa_009916 [Marchantia paleacea]|nr:hypothetical protein Mapa_009916 [Marchantia paleacea]